MAGAYGEEIGERDGVPDRRVRAAAEAESDRGRNRGGHAQRILRAGNSVPVAAGHRHGSEHETGGEPGLAAVVGRAGFARDAQSHVDRERHGALLRDAVPGKRQRRRSAGSADSRHLRRGADGGTAAADSVGAAGRLFAGILGGHGRQRRGGAAHAARRSWATRISSSC